MSKDRFAVDALEFATKAHAGQKRDGGEDYIMHPIRVALKVGSYWKDMGDADELQDYQQAALLHDVVEETDTTINDLVEYGFDPYVIEHVDALTRKPYQSYFMYIDDVAEGHPFSHALTLIKKADIWDNYKTATDSMKERYDKAVRILSYKQLSSASEL
tara:strand:- start:164 stop:640 length:477 start_codon:yes stop_codon:yes gene_type:complete